MWLGPRDSSFGIPCVRRRPSVRPSVPLSSLAVVVVVVVSSSRRRQLLPRRDVRREIHLISKKEDILADCTRNILHFPFCLGCAVKILAGLRLRTLKKYDVKDLVINRNKFLLQYKNS